MSIGSPIIVISSATNITLVTPLLVFPAIANITATTSMLVTTPNVLFTTGTNFGIASAGAVNIDSGLAANIISTGLVLVTAGTVMTIGSTGVMTITAGAALNLGVTGLMTVTAGAALNLGVTGLFNVTATSATVSTGALLMVAGLTANFTSTGATTVLGGGIVIIQSVVLVTIQTTPGVASGTGIFVDAATGVRVVAGGLTRFVVDGNGMDVPGSIKTPTLEIDLGGTSSLRAATAESLAVSNTSATTLAVEICGLKQPNLNTGSAVVERFGKANSAFNTGSLSYTHFGGDGSSTNYVELGLFTAPKVKIDGLGNTTVNGNLTVTGTYPSVSAANWASPGTIGSTTPNLGTFTGLTAAVLDISNTSATDLATIEAYQPSLNTGANSFVNIGVAASQYNSGHLIFNYLGGLNSSTNTIGQDYMPAHDLLLMVLEIQLLMEI